MMRWAFRLVLVWRLAMSCPDTLAIGLIDWWSFEDPGGGGDTILPGSAIFYSGAAEVGTPIDLTLLRTNRATGADLTNTTGWVTETPGGRSAFNGGGRGILNSAIDLASEGGACTIAVRWWRDGGSVQGGGGALDKVQQLCGLSGEYDTTPTLEAGFSLVIEHPNQASPVLAIRRVGEALSAFTGSAAPANPFLAFLTVVRSGANLVYELWIDGARSGPTLTLAAVVDTTKIALGDLVESDGSISQAALWSRKLSDAEISGIGGDMDCLEGIPPAGGGGDGSADPLLETDGTSSIDPEWIVPRSYLGSVLATSGPNRHTRRVHERALRAYELPFRVGAGKDAERIRQALAVTRGGGTTRWRHPKDDVAGPVATAPRWLVRMDGIDRPQASGGAVAAMTLVLEECE